MGESGQFTDTHKPTVIEEIDNEKIASAVKGALEQIVKKNVLFSVFVNKTPMLQTMLNYIPEVVNILMKDKRGIEIMKETGIYDYIRKEE